MPLSFHNSSLSCCRRAWTVVISLVESDVRTLTNQL